MGDREKQNEVRSDNPSVEHCELLLINAGACNGCKNNPYHGKKAVDRELVDNNRDLIERALELSELLETGLIEKRDLNAAEVMMARVAFYQNRFQQQKHRDERQAIMLGSKIAEILAKMFGAK